VILAFIILHRLEFIKQSIIPSVIVQIGHHHHLIEMVLVFAMM